jgi:hypothetical protein
MFAFRKSQQIGIVLFAALCVSACNSKPKSLSPEKYAQWIAKEENGLVKEKKIKTVDIKARFLPSQYLAYNDWLSSDSISYDSVLNSYKCGLSFQIQLEADKADKTYGNLMFYNVPSQEAFMARSRYLSFNIQEFIWLESGETKFEPVLSHFEGYEQLGNKMNFRVVFIVSAYNCGVEPKDFTNVKLTFDDPFWDLGTVNFEFEGKNLVGLPRLEM